MKKIMFNDKYGLTEAVLARRKTQTRRIINDPTMQSCLSKKVHIEIWEQGRLDCWIPGSGIPATDFLQFHKNEIVAVAQSYSAITSHQVLEMNPMYYSALVTHAGWKNKLFVRPDRMPHQIKITNIRIERLQEISDEDCFAEGIELPLCANPTPMPALDSHYADVGRERPASPRRVYASLIDKISGKGTWESNPWVAVYDFELIK